MNHTFELPGGEEHGPIRLRKMRKGTKSCFECRNRKIRCIFLPENPYQCASCFQRGVKCLKQSQVLHPYPIQDSKRHFQRRHSKAGNQMEATLENRTSPKNYNSIGTQTDGLSDHFLPLMTTESISMRDMLGGAGGGPFLTLFNNAIWSSAEDSSHSDSVSQFSSPLTRHKRTCELLRAAWPPPEKLKAILERSKYLWEARRSHLFFGKVDSVEDIAKKAMNSDQPLEIAKIMQHFAENSDEASCERTLHLIDRLIIQDEEYMSSLEGLECAVFQGKIYSDIGQARKSWLTFRRATMHAEILGLHRHRPTVRHERIWHALFLTDRIGSLTLGTPYCLSNSLVEDVVQPKKQVEGLKFRMSTGIAHISGKIIDRVQGRGNVSSVLSIDEELLQVAANAPQGFWNLESVTLLSPQEQVAWHERAFEHLTFFKARLVLHLPEMLRGSEGNKQCRDACFDSARQILLTFRTMRAPEAEAYHFCKANDFVAFFAAITLVLGILGYGDPQDQETDWQLIDTTIDLLKHASTQQFGRVASQSYQALQKLTQFRYNKPASEPGKSVKVVVPCFGTVLVSMDKQSPTQSSSLHDSLRATDSTQSAMGEPLNSPVLHDSLYVQSADVLPPMGNLNWTGFMQPVSDWPNAQDLEIDPNWNWLMNSVDIFTGMSIMN